MLVGTISELSLFFLFAAALQAGDSGNREHCAGLAPDLMDECHDVCDTASLIDELDLVISTDTCVPHIAGALGKPTWLLEAYESEWRWGMADVSPWYESVRVFRQPKLGDWRSVVERVKLELKFMTLYDSSKREAVAA